MCKHEWTKVNDVRICTKCCLTVTYDGKMFFDKKINATVRRNFKNEKSRARNGKRN